MFLPLHVSSDKRLSSGGNNCINTSSGITHWQGDCPTCWSGITKQVECAVPHPLPPDQHVGQLPCQCVIPEDVLIKLFPPDDERLRLKHVEVEK
jgi:hypothetical protein